MAESVEVGRRVRLPRGAGAADPGLHQRDASSGRAPTTRSAAREIVFSRPLVKEKVSTSRWLAMTLGLFGSYGKNETVDVHFRRGGKVQVISDAKILED